MSIWREQQLTERLVEVLRQVPVGDAHAFGRPFLTAYQLAIGLDRIHPDVVIALGQPLGGVGIGQRSSVAQYIARELSRRIASDLDFPIEGAFLSNQDVMAIKYRAPNGSEIVSSLTGTNWDLSMFRLRHAS